MQQNLAEVHMPCKIWPHMKALENKIFIYMASKIVTKAHDRANVNNRNHELQMSTVRSMVRVRHNRPHRAVTMIYHLRN